MSGRLVFDQPGMRVAVSVPVVVLLVFVIATGGMARPLLGGGLLLLAGVIAMVTLLLLGRQGGVPTWWQVVATLVAMGTLPALLVEGLGGPVEVFSLVFVLAALIGAFTYPAPVRAPLLAWVVAAWLGALWWGGLHEIDLLLLHVGAGGLIAYSVVRTADALEHAARGAAASAEAAERRADLLARMLDVHGLDREDVLQALLDGLADVGFAAASVRVPVEDRLALVAGRGLHGRLATEISTVDQLPGRALRTGRVEVVHDRGQLDQLGIEPEAVAAIAVPVSVEDAPAAVITAITTDGPIRPYQREAIELLAILAGRNLRRAQLFEADEHTVSELRRLESRTQDFVSTVSHELRTPLTVVQGLGQTLHDRWDELEPDRRHDLLRRVDANAGRLAEMVRSLLDTSAFEEGSIRLVPEPVELRELVRGLLDRLASVTAAHPVQVQVPGDLWVWADRSLIGNVLENLLTNTAKHTSQGTRIDITADVVDGDDQMGDGGGDGVVEIAIVDDGPGIPAEDLPHVLDRFYRGGHPTSRPPGGLGLGLALADQIVAAHGSQLTIASEEGQGARFAFRLERAHPEQAGVAPVD